MNLDMFEQSKLNIALCNAINVTGSMRDVKAILTQGADIHARDSLDRTPLHYAVAAGSTKISDFLLARGAVVDAVDKHGYTPLHVATHKQHLPLLVRLIDAGADKNRAPTKWQSIHIRRTGADSVTAWQLAAPFTSPLRYCVLHGYCEMVEALLARGARLHGDSSNNGRRRSLIWLATKDGYPRIVALLLRFGANMHRCEEVLDWRGWPSQLSPLDIALREVRVFESSRWPCDQWKTAASLLLHTHIVEIVLALAHFDLPAYVLLWITDWLPHFQNKKELAKITLISKVVASIRSVKQKREARALAKKHYKQ